MDLMRTDVYTPYISDGIVGTNDWQRRRHAGGCFS